MEKLPEKYIGTKFDSLILNNMPLDPTGELEELVGWGKKLQKLEVAPQYYSDNIRGSYGNLGVLLKGYDGIIVTPSASWLGNLGVRDLEEVLGWNTIRSKERPVVISRGPRVPTSESIMYCLAFEKTEDAKAIFHGHDKVVSEAFERGFISHPITTRYYPYGTVEMARTVVEIINSGKYILIKDHHDLGYHGILAQGRTMKEAGELAISVHKYAEKVLKENSS